MIEQTELPKVYQLSQLGVGAIVTGISAVKQRIDIILRTIKGSDPLRPLFGSDVYQFIDSPVNMAVPNIKKAIFDALNLWEPSVQINSITHEINVSQLTFNIAFTTLDDQEASLSWSPLALDSSGYSSGTILTAAIPTKINNGRYSVSLELDGEDVGPTPPVSGFEQVSDMVAWLNENWFAYGRWYSNASKLFVYLNAGIAKAAALQVTQMARIVVRALVPYLHPGESFIVSLMVNGEEAQPEFPAGISSIEQLYLWARNNWADYGAWSLETNTSQTEGDFSGDFSGDFNTGGSVNDVYMVLNTDKFETLTLTID
jgi:phage baseplate assembly protein W